jgi:hypothetical protein
MGPRMARRCILGSGVIRRGRSVGVGGDGLLVLGLRQRMNGLWSLLGVGDISGGGIGYRSQERNEGSTR